MNRAELLEAIVAAVPQDGQLIYIERRGDDYQWARSGAGEVVDTPQAGTFPDAWMYYSGTWPLDNPDKLPAFFDDLLSELETMTGGGPDRCRWDPGDPYPHLH